MALLNRLAWELHILSAKDLADHNAVGEQRLTRTAGRSARVTAHDEKVARTTGLKAQGILPEGIGKVIDTSRSTVYRYLSLNAG